MLGASKLGSVGGLYIKLFSRLQWAGRERDQESVLFPAYTGHAWIIETFAGSMHNPSGDRINPRYSTVSVWKVHFLGLAGHGPYAHLGNWSRLGYCLCNLLHRCPKGPPVHH